MKFLVVNGPNLNMLGVRDKNIYGSRSYRDLVDILNKWAKEKGIELMIFQSNHEGEMIDFLQREQFDGLVINPGALTHYGYSLRDALETISVPKIEVHISNVHKREEFRRKSVTAEVCDGQIIGLGILGYILALEYLYQKLTEKAGF